MPPVKELLCSPPALFLLPALIHLASGLYFSTFFTAPWWYPAPLLFTAGAIFGLSAVLKFHKSRISPLSITYRLRTAFLSIFNTADTSSLCRMYTYDHN